MQGRAVRMNIMAWAMSALLIAAGSALGGEQAAAPSFKFVGGNAKLPESCEGSLELTSKALTFVGPKGSISVSYASITLMQYRPDISRQVWKMKIPWQVKPALSTPMVKSKRNRYFTVVYEEQGAPRALVLEVSPEAMRPYLAEIDLKSGKRVEVKTFEKYD